MVPAGEARPAPPCCGVAHLVEHLVFRSTKAFPEPYSVDGLLSSFGMQVTNKPVAVFTRIFGYLCGICPPSHHGCRSSTSQ